MTNFVTKFLNWIEQSKHFDEEKGLPDLNQIINIHVSEDRKLCWAIGYNSVGNAHSVIFDDLDGYTIEELDYQRNWQDIVSHHSQLFNMGNII